MKALGCFVVLMAVVAVRAEPARYPITAAQVANALSGDGIQVEGQQISMLAKVTAPVPAPQLDVMQSLPAHGVEGGKKSLVKLRCRAVQQCLPFYVLLDGEFTVPERQPARAAVKKSVARRPVITMRAGTHAVLELDSQRAHMQVAVVSLENGAMGSRIRVATLDRKEFFEGEVAGPTLLKGSF